MKASEEKTQRTRMQFYLSYMGLATAMAPIAGRADVVVATTPPLFTGVAGLALARLNRAPFVLDVRDLWPSAAVSLMQIDTGRTLPGGGVARADALSTGRRSGRRDAAVLRARGQDSRLPAADDADSERDARDVPRGGAENGRAVLGAADDEFVVTFAGTHGIAQGLDTIVRAAPLLEGEASFALVGDGPLKAPLVQLAATRACAMSPSTTRCRLRRRRPFSLRATPCSCRSPRTRPSATSFPRS